MILRDYFLMVAYTALLHGPIRSIGLSKFLSGYRDKGVDPDQIYVDHNLRAIGLLSQFFPREHDFWDGSLYFGQ